MESFKHSRVNDLKIKKKKNLKSFQGFLVSLFCVIFPYHVKVTMLFKKKNYWSFFFLTKYELYFMTVLVLARGCFGSCGQSFPGRCRAG